MGRREPAGVVDELAAPSPLHQIVPVRGTRRVFVAPTKQPENDSQIACCRCTTCAPLDAHAGIASELPRLFLLSRPSVSFASVTFTSSTMLPKDDAREDALTSIDRGRFLTANTAARRA
jgi:hypothetical protein